MADVAGEDGRVLGLAPVPVAGRDGVAYEVGLALTLDGRPWGQVGERCAYRLAQARERLRDGAGLLETGVRAWAREQGLDPDGTWRGLERHLPHDVELLSLRARDPDDLPGRGALRALLVTSRRWQRGGWQVERCVRLEAWGDDGTGLRGELPTERADALLGALLEEVAAVRTAPAPG